MDHKQKLIKNSTKYFYYFKTAAFFILVILFSNMRVFAQNDSIEKKEKIIYGTASYYANKFNGRKTANGDIFDQNKFTAASNKLPLGTWVKVTNLRNGNSVIVRINDRMSSKMKRVIDLSSAGAKKLGFIKSGTTRVKMKVLSEFDNLEP